MCKKLNGGENQLSETTKSEFFKEILAIDTDSDTYEVRTPLLHMVQLRDDKENGNPKKSMLVVEVLLAEVRKINPNLEWKIDNARTDGIWLTKL